MLTLNIIPQQQLSLRIICDGRQCKLGSPVKGGKWICPHNNLQALHPQICKEWDYEKNEGIPTDYLPGSQKQIWWKCITDPCGCHSWQTKIYHRTKSNSGCPFCRRGHKCPHNNLTTTHPDLCLEWDYDRNNQLPNNYTRGSIEKVWWKCSRSKCSCHRWEATINHRVIEGTGCPFCNSGRPCDHYNLLVTNPELTEEWDYERNIDKPEDYSPYSHKQIWWKCSRSTCDCHKWRASIAHRSFDGNGCPFCFLGKACQHYNLLVTMPTLAQEWNYDRNSTKPEEYAPCSNTKVWWRCKKNPQHEWEVQINHRNRKDNIRGCPFCVHRRYSKMQIEWLTHVSNCNQIHIIHAENSHEYHIPNVGFVDGYCPETNTVYEFHGDFYHGHPSKYNSTDINPLVEKTYGELYTRTLERDNLIVSLGYNLVSMWEHEYLSSKRL